MLGVYEKGGGPQVGVLFRNIALMRRLLQIQTEEYIRLHTCVLSTESNKYNEPSPQKRQGSVDVQCLPAGKDPLQPREAVMPSLSEAKHCLHL